MLSPGCSVMLRTDKFEFFDKKFGSFEKGRVLPLCRDHGKRKTYNSFVWVLKSDGCFPPELDTNRMAIKLQTVAMVKVRSVLI